MTERGVGAVKINEVERKAGITKKNIRFYEEQGLILPRRNSENGYREYGDEEVQVLRRIKLLRKLGIPIEEIRQMLGGTLTVADGMRRHLISLERERRNLEQSVLFCQELQSMDVPITALDADAILDKMETLEKGGTWDGSVRNLKNLWSPLYCFDDGSQAMQELECMGASLIDIPELSDFRKLAQQNLFFP